MLSGILLIHFILVSLTVCCSGDLVLLKIKDMTLKADVILIGRVESVTHHTATYEDVPKMHRKVKVTVERYLKNPQDSSEVVILVLGATIGSTSMWVEDQPSFENSERVLVFLRANPLFLQTNPRGYYQVLGGYPGKFTIESGLAVNEAGQKIADGRIVEQVKFVLKPKPQTMIYTSILAGVFIVGAASLILYYRKSSARESIRLLKEGI